MSTITKLTPPLVPTNPISTSLPRAVPARGPVLSMPPVPSCAADHTATRGPALVAGLPPPPSRVGVSVVGTPRDLSTHAAAFVVSDEVRANTVAQMVDGVLERADGDVLDRLEIYDHGTAGCQLIGAEGIVLVNGALPQSLRDELDRLTPRFTPDAEVTLHGCHVGQGEEGRALLVALAELWGVTVRAGEGAQNPVLPGLEGREVTAVVWDHEHHHATAL